MSSPQDRFQQFRAPESKKVGLPMQPRLASWDHASHPSQLRLGAFLDSFEGTVKTIVVERLGRRASRRGAGWSQRMLSV